ncbi:hypothetical protein PWT90_06414 [Aphanocladium album]|nr:hypothetical protein PWT90_06414 [Aphanocladium album]
MALPRESTFLPTIKCSQCGNEVEISMMGEHLCAALATPECRELQVSLSTSTQADKNTVTPPLEAEETFENSYQATRNKYLRTPPPVDTGAANRYLSQGQLTPVSHSSSSRNTSPKTPSRRSGINRRYNDDYAPEIAQDDGQRSPRGYGRRPGGYGGFRSQTPEPESNEEPEPLAKEAPAPTFFQRMGELAGGYGGFGARPVEPSTEPEKPVESEPEPEPPQEAPGFLQRINDLAGSAFDAGRRPSTANKSTFPQRKDSLDHWDPPPELTVSSDNQLKPVRQNGYGGFNNPAAGENASRGMARAETFPRPAYPNDMSGRRPSAAGPQSDMNRRPSAPYQQSNGGDINRRPSMGPDTSRRPPPRTSLIKHRANSSSVDLDKEFGVRNPYHTPTDSMSSGYSSHSEHSNPPMNNGPDRYMERNNSNPVSRPRQQQQPPPMHESNAKQRRDNARPDLRIDPAIQEPQRGPGRFVESPYSASPRDDRYDPAIQPGLGGSRGNHYDSLPKQNGFDRGYGANGSNGRSNDRGYGSGPMPPPPSAPVRQGSRDPLYAPSRGDCKACRMPITGKSISSADGRLTGKYHKACFVCTTCTRPFSSAEFYVHRDRPYCEIHYHKLNGSLCGSCDRGIEGQYAEDEGRVKYHVGCFRCLDCGVSLSDGYFEVDGKSYCERDAWRRIELEAPPVLEPAPEQDHNGGNNYSTPPPPLPNGTAVPPTSNGRPAGRGMAARGTGAGMERGPYGVAPGSRTRLNKRMTRIGMM